ncbi:MAG TPA: UbiA family prenyltransferase [Candidatus Thermoplasmatota archaeon]
MGGNTRSFWWAYGKICRLEYISGEAPAVFIPALLTLTSFESLLSLAVLEGVAVFAILYVTGFMVNALTDRELDLKYDSFKHEIGEATAQLGDRTVRGLLALHLAAAGALATHLAVMLQAPWLVLLVAAGAFLALAYSLDPFHLKVRGLAAHAFSLALPAFAIPFLFLYFVAARTIDAHAWMICGSFTLTHYGLTYVNQAYDFDEDMKEGVRTPPVRLGLDRALGASFAMVAVGLPLLTFSVVSLALSRAPFLAVAGPAGAAAFAVGGSALLAAGYSVPLRGILRMRAITRASASEREAVPEFHRSIRYSSFHAAGISALAVFALVLFAVTVSSSAALDAQAVQSLRVDVRGEPDRSAAGGPTADIHVDVANGGALAFPPGSVLVRVDARHAPSGGGYWSVTAPLEGGLGAGAAATATIANVPLRGEEGGTEIRVTLLVDSDGDHQGLKPAATTSLLL